MQRSTVILALWYWRVLTSIYQCLTIKKKIDHRATSCMIRAASASPLSWRLLYMRLYSPAIDHSRPCGSLPYIIITVLGWMDVSGCEIITCMISPHDLILVPQKSTKHSTDFNFFSWNQVGLCMELQTQSPLYSMQILLECQILWPVWWNSQWTINQLFFAVWLPHHCWWCGTCHSGVWSLCVMVPSSVCSSVSCLLRSWILSQCIW